MKICCCVCTYNRPSILGHLIRCFEKQIYEDREMVILDDAGQYKNQSGDKWELISIPRRFRTLGEKRNAVMALASLETELVCSWDDDDFYLPSALTASVASLEYADWSVPSLALMLQSGEKTLRKVRTGPGKFFHAGMAFRREILKRVGGYPAESGSEDQGLFRKLESIGAIEVDPIALGHQPAYIFNGNHSSSISLRGGTQTAYDKDVSLESSENQLVIIDPTLVNLDNPEINPIIYLSH